MKRMVATYFGAFLSGLILSVASAAPSSLLDVRTWLTGAAHGVLVAIAVRVPRPERIDHA